MNTQSVKAFFSKIFGKNSTLVACDDCSDLHGLKAMDESFKDMYESVENITQSIQGIKEDRISLLGKIHARIIEISNFTTTSEFADMVVNRPYEVRKLRAELDALVVKSTNV